VLQDYVLDSDVEAIYLKKTLSKQTNQRIEDFLARYPDRATSNDLLRNWLKHLHKTRQWEKYLEYTPEPNGKNSTARHCRYLEATIKAGRTVDLSQQALPLWMVGTSQPKACDALFGILKQRGLLTKPRIHARIDLALERARFSLASHLKAFLPGKERKVVAAKIGLWRKMYSKPITYLRDARTWRDGNVSRAIISYGIRKQARRDIATALKLWPGLSKRFAFNKSERDTIENYLAINAAHQRHPRAGQVYAATDRSSMSLREREWQVRNALWEQDWQAVLGALKDLPEKSQQTSQWTYWRARALQATGQTAQAHTLFTQLSQGHGYFEFLAADRLSQTYQFRHAPLAADSTSLQRLENLTAFKRARELAQVNMPGRSRSEWLGAMRKLSAPEKNQAGLLAKRWGLATSSIQTAVNSQAREDIDILYPRAYEEHVVKTAKRFALEPAWVLGVIRQESLFMPDVRSSANAYGLMQLLPATAKQTARKNKMRYRGYAHLVNPERNIELGSAYLAEVHKRLQSNPALASAAYNGGPHRVRRWLPKKDMDADVWVENIVFNETRNYVQKVLTNKVIYSWRLQGQPLRLNSFMKPVYPLGGSINARREEANNTSASPKAPSKP
ncbi:MAG: transglycosylase SLT domain-containing protein, partial [Gammaproteobacteria bacterium]|nr:transglycosylase SLT domain-containing protein [Gammaproteobacteria bacterium]